MAGSTGAGYSRDGGANIPPRQLSPTPHTQLVTMLSSILAAIGLVASFTAAQQPPRFLNLTAIAAAHGESTLECWQLDSPFTSSSSPGTVGALSLFMGELANATYTVLPARFDGGFHRAPARQFVLFTSGLAHITLYKGKNEAWVQGGKYGLIIAADTQDVSQHGHRTEYPSGADTIGIQIPISDESSFEYKVLHSGACHECEMTGI
ncbi:hypothetical protein VHEMI04169 [[Torrubiella] hemipterigena]|uniref:Small secreted protein n=1 Tax=[Torrubiella] hemipterigena TaxID=1531966 RepID=A0A0A1SUM8_9HYPO|nr:hypothetical protein VHEMI04169 [[Torrubiella] hemipterigena]